MIEWYCKKCGSHGAKDKTMIFCPFCGNQLISQKTKLEHIEQEVNSNDINDNNEKSQSILPSGIENTTSLLPFPSLRSPQSIPIINEPHETNMEEKDFSDTEVDVKHIDENQSITLSEEKEDKRSSYVPSQNLEDYEQLSARFSLLKKTFIITLIRNNLSRIKARLIDCSLLIIIFSGINIYAIYQSSPLREIIKYYFLFYFICIPVNILAECSIYAIFKNTLGKKCYDIFILNEHNNKMRGGEYLKRNAKIYCCIFLFCIPQIIFNVLIERCNGLKKSHKISYAFGGKVISKQVLIPFENISKIILYFRIMVLYFILPSIFWGSLACLLFFAYNTGFFIELVTTYVVLITAYIFLLLLSIYVKPKN